MEYYKHPPEYSPLPPEQPLRPELELAAPPPEKIAADPAAAKAKDPPFPRAELLKID